MKDKFQEFFSKHNGQFLEVNDPTNKNQCMDLAYGWCDFLGIPRDTIRHLYAKEVYTKATDLTKQYFDLIANSPEGVPEIGDLVVFSEKIGGIAGHISISNGVGDTESFESFDQNLGTPKYCRLVKHNYKAVLGWLRPKVSIETNMPEWFTKLLQEKNLTIDDESEIRGIFDKAKNYDDKVKELSEQLKGANESLATTAGQNSLLVQKVEKLEGEKTTLEEQLNTTRSERDTAIWEKERSQVLSKTLADEIEILNKKVESLAGNNPLGGYSWLRRLLSLFSG